jgi:hypothetical protein
MSREERKRIRKIGAGGEDLMIATIGVEGHINVYTSGTMPVFNVSGAVKVQLNREGKYVGSVTFSHLATQVNPRATEATFLLSGAYTRITGEALFEVADEDLLYQVVAEVSQ